MTLAAPHRPLPMKLLNGVGQILSTAGINRPVLDLQSIMNQAVKAVGKEDFGDPSFKQGFEVLIQALDSEANLNQTGRLMAQQEILGYLKNRLLIEDYRQRHPDITSKAVKAPLIILGLPRTGTTLLVNLLAQDPQNHAPMGWEVSLPVPPPLPHSYLVDPRIYKAQRMFNQLDKLNPRLAFIHKMEACLPQECVAITAHHGMAASYGVLYKVPSYQRWLDQQSFIPALEFHKRFLQHLQCHMPERTWVLKSPAHLPYIAELLHVYPDARIIHTHRDPRQVLPSMASLCYNLRSIGSDRADPLAIGKQQVEFWDRNLQRAMHDRKKLADRHKQFFDVQFEEVLSDPLGLIARIYDHYDLPLSVEARAAMARFLANNPRDKYGVHRYSLEDFGLSTEVNGPRFQEYCEYFQVAQHSLHY